MKLILKICLQITFIYQVYSHGKMSRYVKQWEIGTKVQIRGPSGQFKYKPNKVKKHSNEQSHLFAG